MELNERIGNLKENFKKHFGAEPTDVFSSPGRIELCGNHTDHNNGKVLVASIDLNILAVVRQNHSNMINFISEGFNEMNVNLDDLEINSREFGSSFALIKGVAYKMKKMGYNINGFDVYCNSTIFKGAGVSSSAAFEVLIAKIISYYFNKDSIEPFVLAQVSQFAESVYFNKPCGLLDQSGIALGGINYIDFKDTSKPVINNLKIDIPDYQFVLINTGDDHTKLTDCYASIKNDMKKVSTFFNKEVLREIDPVTFKINEKEIEQKLGNQALLRAEHYFEENERVKNAYDDLQKGNVLTLFKMMNESGISSYNKLKNCYVNDENEKLPLALKYCASLPQTVCSRVHGGGFAGTMLMVVKKEEIITLKPVLDSKFGATNVMLVNVSKEGTCHLMKL